MEIWVVCRICAMDIAVYVICEPTFTFLFTILLGVKQLSHFVYVCLTLVDTDSFPKHPYQFTFPIVWKRSAALFWTIVSIFHFFYFSHNFEQWCIPLCLNLHFLKIKLNMYSGPLEIQLCKTSIWIFHLFSVIDLFVIDL
jgi:hypothetical protein